MAIQIRNIIMNTVYINKKLAKKHFSHLYNNWISNEQKHYEEYFIIENANNIPTTKLKNHNYKDLRVIKDFFEIR